MPALTRPANLYSLTGTFIQEFQIPKFKTQPKVIIWDKRAFLLSEDNNYIEVFSHLIND
ncbi:hypothetical protein [Calothrix sp. 336/3]|uniref:hypothetical protein n=1 Tax=Calothrix sp. 336/3 TaxID=1337936 RepID=UPI000A504F5F|nr:hypothetical protein [Calothrix sp. 336/3]